MHSRRRLAGLLAACAFGCGSPVVARADGEPPASPILIVEPGTHTGSVHKIVVDAARSQVVTVGNDKTIRLWGTPDLQLRATFRVPIADGNEGQLYAAALSPDGKTLAVGGWTGWAWDEKASVYLIDMESGSMVRRIAGFPEGIGALAFSPDGEHLAIGLLGSAGLFVLQLSDYRIAARDTRYADKIIEVDYDSTGRLVASSLDGLIRLYDQHARLLVRKRMTAGNKPSSIKFSPDGARIAVGYYDTPRVSVLSAVDLSPIWSSSRDAAPELINLYSLSWAARGNKLCAGGEARPARPNAIRCWPAEGSAKPVVTRVARTRVGDMAAVPSGELVFTTDDPSVGLVGTAGQVTTIRDSELLNFVASTLKLAPDGSVISFPGARELAYFSVFEAEAEASAGLRRRLQGPIGAAEGLTIEHAKDGYRPVLNGKALALEPYERSRCHAIAPDLHSVVLGTEWNLRRIDNEARSVWSSTLPAAAHAITVSGDGQLVVAGLADGTLRWYRMDDGAEVLALFVHAPSKEWIAWIPSGYYMSSPQGDNYVGWHLNQGKESAPDFVLASQFDRLLYRPDLVQAYFKSKGRALPEIGGQNGFDAKRLAEIAPPRLRLERVRPSDSDGRRAHFRLSAQRTRLPMRDLAVFVNNIPVTGARDRELSASEGERFSREIDLELAHGINRVRVEVFNGVSIGVTERIVLSDATDTASARGNLYVLAIGVGKFARLPGKFALSFTTQDAEDMASALQRTGSGAFADVHVKLLTDTTWSKPDKNNILSALEFARNARARDTVVVFLASHGISDAAGNYYFVPRDADPKDIEQLSTGRTPGGNSLVSWKHFFEALRSMAGRRILIVDTCQAKNIAGTFDSHNLAKRSASSRFALVVAARGGEDSQEYAPGRHGLFTYALLEGLKGAADSDADRMLTLKELFDYAVPLVERTRDRRLGPQTPQMISPTVLRDSLIGQVTGGAR